MLGLSGFGRSKSRKFEYKPRHWDPEAEERETRRRMILGEDYAEGAYKPGMYIREKRMMRMRDRDRESGKSGQMTLVRLAIFICLALAVVYLMFTQFGMTL